MTQDKHAEKGMSTQRKVLLILTGTILGISIVLLISIMIIESIAGGELTEEERSMVIRYSEAFIEDMYEESSEVIFSHYFYENDESTSYEDLSELVDEVRSGELTAIRSEDEEIPEIGRGWRTGSATYSVSITTEAVEAGGSRDIDWHFTWVEDGDGLMLTHLPELEEVEE
ncbi:hypothetical protein CR205_03325 [Alteribacter lacisalsi]|uniref:Uncharacterized protein n=1 Tax=Alteribacter lacisalsi TaxID=2045244 RepID=A0A2W0HLA0_9BACI|nr:hypothetical protein [Alteribacter lacisalsi]PYZ97639.1 hypothetical protein CR205_03325 [Alteribacter lacisalsi]